jgi:thioesterase domain-containing protein
VFWKHLVTGRVQVHLVSGDHGSIINDVHAVEFALVFRQALLEAEATAERSSTQR